jgi:hypothetical protein
MIRYHRSPIVVAFMAGLLTVAACGSSGAPSTPGGSSTSSNPASTAPGGVAAPTGGVDPNAPEVNDAGDIPDNQVFVPYTPSSGLFTLKVPEGWSRVDGANAVTFGGKLNNIRIEVAPRASAPDEAAVRAEVATIGATSTGFSAGNVQQATRPAGTVIVAKYRADTAPDPVTGKAVNDDVERYEFWHGGQVLILTLSGPHGADNVDPWHIVTDSVRWQR